ncbi:hypothetical protein H5410_003959 [Solanum commersonii]|uniref:Uncharacterized protein n=1 Tax=Solanum commersonii TaxID=4109 RepID=A0A9J6B6L6_SOLCO|nr:hypothetical protein H5410_003959 [Solanum commersonii]
MENKGKPMGEIMHCVYLWHLNTFVELEIAFAASIVSLRFFDNGSPNALGESPNGLNLVQSSSVLSPEGKDQVGDKREQSTRRQTVPRSNTILPNDSKRKDTEGKS